MTKADCHKYNCSGAGDIHKCVALGRKCPAIESKGGEKDVSVQRREQEKA